MKIRAAGYGTRGPLWLAVSVLLLLLCSDAGAMASSTRASADSPGASTGKSIAAPDCALALVTDKTHSTLRQFRGKVLYVDFWASWCTSCVLSFPFLNELNRSYQAQGLQVVGMNMDQKPADAQRFLDEHAAKFAIALGSNAQCAKDFGVAGMPSSYLIDRNGSIRYVHQGFRANDTVELRKQVEQLLAERPASP